MTPWEALVAGSALTTGSAWDLFRNPKPTEAPPPVIQKIVLQTFGGLEAKVEVPPLYVSLVIPEYTVTLDTAGIAVKIDVLEIKVFLDDE